MQPEKEKMTGTPIPPFLYIKIWGLVCVVYRWWWGHDVEKQILILIFIICIIIML